MQHFLIYMGRHGVPILAGLILIVRIQQVGVQISIKFNMMIQLAIFLVVHGHQV